jgi:hypothetical protein
MELVTRSQPQPDAEKGAKDAIAKRTETTEMGLGSLPRNWGLIGAFVLSALVWAAIIGIIWNIRY